MTLLAFRRIKVFFGLPGADGVGGDGLSISSTDGYRIAFDVKFTSRSRPNKAKVKIYNLSPESVRLLEREGSVMSVVAGYRDKTGTVIKGDITTVNHTTSDTEIVTECEVKDSGFAYRNSRFDYHFGAGATNREIIRRIADDMNIGLGYGVQSIPEIRYAGDVTFNGYARDALSEVLADIGAEWSLVDGQLQIMVANDEPTALNGILLTESTGLIKAERKKKGVEIVGLMQPEIRPGRLIRVVSAKIEGDYVARTVEHSGDSDEGAHTTKIMARRISSATYPREG